MEMRFNLRCFFPPVWPGKPSPPSQPQVQEVNHNSVTLTWNSPRHNGLGSSILAYTVEQSSPTHTQWTVVTSCCQGNSYQVKNLKPKTEYVFRVRAENIHGRGKPSRPSDVVQTKAQGPEVAEIAERYIEAPPDEAQQGVQRRRHSFSLHLEGAVTSILTRTDPEAKNRMCEAEGVCKELGQLQREAFFRSSLQPSRKRSLPIILPGRKTNSLRKLRDSQTCPSIKSLAGSEGWNTLKKHESILNNSIESGIGVEVKFEGNEVEGFGDKSSVNEETKLDAKNKKNERKEECSPWLKVNSLSDESDSILTAPVSDDVKLAVYTRSLPSDSTWSSADSNSSCDTTTREPPADFRTLRSLLHSAEIIVKPTWSMPDVTSLVGAQKTGSVRSNKLSTIIDMDEKEESVRITTL